MSSLSWPAVVGTYISTTVATTGAIGTGDYTIVALTKPGSTGGHAAIGMQVTSSYDIQIIVDTGVWFGGGDFSGFGTVTTDWQIIGQSKTSGSNVLRWHYWNYTLGGAKTHADGTGTHANPGALTNVRIGDGDNRGNGLNAFVVLYKRVISDSEFDNACTTKLIDWLNLPGGAPTAIWALNVAAASVVDGSGNGNNEASVSGTISLTGADPPGFDYSLVSATADGSFAPTVPPPHLLDGFVSSRALAFQDSRTFATVAATPAATLGALAAAATATAFTPDHSEPRPTPPFHLLEQFAAARSLAFLPDRTPADNPATLAGPLGALTAAAAATPTVSAAVVASLGVLAAAATATTFTPEHGETQPPTPPLHLVEQFAAARALAFQDSRTAITVTATATATLGALTANINISANNVAATAAATLGVLAAAATATHAVTPSAAAPLGRAVAAAAATRRTTATATAGLGALSATLTVQSGAGLAGGAHGPLPLAAGSIIVHTGTIAGAIT